MTWRVEHGDCRDRMAAMPADSVDALVSDPPYGLSFMGKGWDRGVPGVEFWEAARRVVRPGAYLLAFGGTRTYHRLACAIEDAGWEIHDCLSWLYGSGFPKHRSKLKPAWEPIILARRPAPRATPLNIEACRIEFASDEDEQESKEKNRHADFGSGARENEVYGADNRTRAEAGNYDADGRWPANVALDEEAAEHLDEQGGTRPGIPAIGKSGASRFFYCAKASRREREAGLDGHPARLLGSLAGGGEGATDPVSLRFTKTARNVHPTVKPLALMRWLVRLVTPPDGLVLDPFMGSGSTGCAAVLEGRRFVGCELDADYAAIARARIAHWAEQAQPALALEAAS